MTAKRRHGIKCPNCESEIRTDTQFSQWIRNLEYPLNGARCSCHNLDYVWFPYYDNWFITIEEKIKGKKYNPLNKSDLSQIQIHQLIRQMLEFASGNKFDISFGGRKRVEKIDYRGHYLITFENNDPDNSKWIEINKKPANKYILVTLLRFGILMDQATLGLLPTPLSLSKAISKKIGYEVSISEVVTLFFN